jgi:hypothetical protein
MSPILTNDEIDSLPVVRFQATIERLASRREWGRRAGVAAFHRGNDRNPFVKQHCMPMHGSWERGYEEALSGSVWTTKRPATSS